MNRAIERDLTPSHPSPELLGTILPVVGKFVRFGNKVLISPPVPPDEFDREQILHVNLAMLGGITNELWLKKTVVGDGIRPVSLTDIDAGEYAIHQIESSTSGSIVMVKIHGSSYGLNAPDGSTDVRSTARANTARLFAQQVVDQHSQDGEQVLSVRASTPRSVVTGEDVMRLYF